MSGRLGEYIEALEGQIGELLKALPEQLIEPELQARLKVCTMRAREKKLAEVAKNLEPAVAFLSYGAALEAHPESRVYKQYEACAWLMMKIETEITRLDLPDFGDVGATPREFSVCPWMDDVLTHYWQLRDQMKLLPDPQRRKLSAFSDDLHEVGLIIQELFGDHGAEHALGHKNFGFKQIAKELAYKKPLPEEIEKALQKLTATLENHSSPDVFEKVVERNRNAQLKRGVYFSANLPQQVSALEKLVQVLGPMDKEMTESFSHLRTLQASPVWFNGDEKEQLSAAIETLQELQAITHTLENTTSITRSDNPNILNIYEVIWCVATAISENAQNQYYENNPRIIEHALSHPLDRALKVFCATRKHSPLTTEIDDVMHRMRNNRILNNASTLKHLTVDKLITLLSPDITGAQELAGILFDFATTEQCKAISLQMNPPPQSAESLMGFVAQLDSFTEKLKGQSQIRMDFELHTLEVLAEKPGDKQELKTCLSNIGKILSHVEKDASQPATTLRDCHHLHQNLKSLKTKLLP